MRDSFWMIRLKRRDTRGQGTSMLSHTLRLMGFDWEIEEIDDRINKVYLFDRIVDGSYVQMNEAYRWIV
jgi:hypothetical protein